MVARTNNPILDITSTIKNEIIYWKDRRNDITHNKREFEGTALTDLFWMFLRNNL